jgi:hypothetical protein
VQKDRIGSWEVSGLTGAALPLPARNSSVLCNECKHRLIERLGVLKL